MYALCTENALYKNVHVRVYNIFCCLLRSQQITEVRASFNSIVHTASENITDMPVIPTKYVLYGLNGSRMLVMYQEQRFFLFIWSCFVPRN